MLSRAGSSINPWGAPLGTSLHLDFVPAISRLSPTGRPVISPALCPLHQPPLHQFVCEDGMVGSVDSPTKVKITVTALLLSTKPLHLSLSRRLPAWWSIFPLWTHTKHLLTLASSLCRGVHPIRCLYLSNLFKCGLLLWGQVLFASAFPSALRHQRLLKAGLINKTKVKTMQYHSSLQDLCHHISCPCQQHFSLSLYVPIAASPTGLSPSPDQTPGGISLSFLHHDVPSTSPSSNPDQLFAHLQAGLPAFPLLWYTKGLPPPCYPSLS